MNNCTAFFNRNLDQELTVATKLRLLLHRTLYEDQDAINDLINIIETNLETISTDYDYSNKTISIKIKKTSMRRKIGSILNTTIFDDIMNQFFNKYISRIEQDAKAGGYEFNKNIQDIVYNTYSITCVSENIAIIHL